MATVNCILTGQEKGISDVVDIENGGTGAVSAPSAVGNLVRGLSEETTMADGDYIPLSDTSASGIGKKISKSNLRSTLGVSSASSTTPKVAGTASTGSETAYARGDHVHPVQTSVSGNAGTATKLATGRNIQTNLASTNSAVFDGSASITPGILGILPVTNGGTGGGTAGGGIYSLTNGAAAETSLATNDYFPFLDTSASGGKKISVANIKNSLGITDNANNIIKLNTHGNLSSSSQYTGKYLTYTTNQTLGDTWYYNCTINLNANITVNTCVFINCVIILSYSSIVFTGCSFTGCDILGTNASVGYTITSTNTSYRYCSKSGNLTIKAQNVNSNNVYNKQDVTITIGT